MKLFRVKIRNRKAVITVVNLLWCRWSRFLMVLIPSSFGMFVYSDRTSSVTRKESLDSVAGTFASSVRKWLVSLR